MKNLQLAKENVQLELNFLKSQVNPHFLFNTLNNLYGLIIHQRHDKSAEIVARLSDFMRYTLYDSAEALVSLEKEVNLINNYIELEQLRLNYTKVVFNVMLDRKDYYLPPLLFMPIVENAFKYTVDKKTGSIIYMDLKVDQGLLYFKIQNSFEPLNSKNEIGGLGLVNLQKRLSLLFPNKNTCQNNVEGFNYIAQLTLNLT